MSERASFIAEPARAARAALRPLRLASTDEKNAALRAAARLLREGETGLLAANRRDLDARASVTAARSSTA